ncbi:MAG: hypothetical protein ACHQX1_00390 [Candidatus Micrarchaeales archaeon]
MNLIVSKGEIIASRNAEAPLRAAIRSQNAEPVAYTDAQQHFFHLIQRKFGMYNCDLHDKNDSRLGVRLFDAFDNEKGKQVLDSLGVELVEFEKLAVREHVTYFWMGAGGAIFGLNSALYALSEKKFDLVSDVAIGVTAVFVGLIVAAITLYVKYSPVVDKMQKSIFSKAMSMMELRIEDFGLSDE